MATKKFLENIQKYVEEYEIEGKINSRIEKYLLRNSKTKNAEEVLEEIKNRIDQYKMYDDFSFNESDFPYETYIEKLSKP